MGWGPPLIGQLLPFLALFITHGLHLDSYYSSHWLQAGKTGNSVGFQPSKGHRELTNTSFNVQDFSQHSLSERLCKQI